MPSFVGSDPSSDISILRKVIFGSRGCPSPCVGSSNSSPSGYNAGKKVGRSGAYSLITIIPFIRVVGFSGFLGLPYAIGSDFTVASLCYFLLVLGFIVASMAAPLLP